MNTALKLTGFALIAAALLTGCGKKEAKPAAPAFGCTYKGQPAPEWYCVPEIGDGVAALGEAAPNRGGDRNMQRSMAVAQARAALAQDLEVKVKTMVTNWTRVTGAGEGQTYETNAENVSKQVASQTLQGSKILKSWEAPDGTLVVLVGVTNASLQLKNSIQTSLRNEEALWQQFQSQKAQEALDAEFEKEFGKR
ncbi:MAG: LPP20 family lipoprotein [Campylobacterales bacterium]